MSIADIFDRHAAGAQGPSAQPDLQAALDAADPDVAAVAARHAGNAVIRTRELSYLAHAPIGDSSFRIGDDDTRDEEEEEKEKRRQALGQIIQSNAQVYSQIQEDAATFLAEEIARLDTDIASVTARLAALEKLQEALNIRLLPLRTELRETQNSLTSNLQAANRDGHLCHAVDHAECHVHGHGETAAQERMRGIVERSLRAPGADGAGPLIVACRTRSGEIVDYYLIDRQGANLLSELPEERRGAVQAIIDSYQNGEYPDRQISDLPDFIRTAMAAEGHGTVANPHAEVTFLVEGIQDNLDNRHRIEREIKQLEGDSQNYQSEINALRAELDTLKTKREEAVSLLRDIKEKNLDGPELQKAMEASSFGSAWNSFLEATGTKEIVDLAASYIPAPLKEAAENTFNRLTGLFTSARDGAAAPQPEEDPATTPKPAQSPAPAGM